MVGNLKHHNYYISHCKVIRTHFLANLERVRIFAMLNLAKGKPNHSQPNQKSDEANHGYLFFKIIENVVRVDLEFEYEVITPSRG